MSLKITILGCGSSGGVPRIGGKDGKGNWGECDPLESKNKRGRCALLIEKKSIKGITRILVDAGPDMREQLLREGIGHVDAVLLTHEHADHSHGLDDLRMIALETKKPVPVYFSRFAQDIFLERFKYCFFQAQGSIYPPILTYHIISPNESFTIMGEGGDIDVLPLHVHHGKIDALGFRFNNLAYIPDMHDMPKQTIEHMHNLEYWIIDALRYQKHIAHLNFEKALEWLDAIKPRWGVLTNMHIDLDYQTLRRSLPKNVVPAYDGMVIEIT